MGFRMGMDVDLDEAMPHGRSKRHRVLGNGGAVFGLHAPPCWPYPCRPPPISRLRQGGGLGEGECIALIAKAGLRGVDSEGRVRARRSRSLAAPINAWTPEQSIIRASRRLQAHQTAGAGNALSVIRGGPISVCSD